MNDAFLRCLRNGKRDIWVGRMLGFTKLLATITALIIAIKSLIN